MSVTHNKKKDGISAEGLAAFRASVLAEIEQRQTETEESIITSIRENLVSAPVEGEAWDERKSYITGDTATDDGVSYTALRFSRGKRPSEHPEHWALTPAAVDIPAWDDIEDGTVIMEGTQVTHDGFTWVCTSQHIKSTVYKPKAVSTKWEKVE